MRSTYIPMNYILKVCGSFVNFQLKKAYNASTENDCSQNSQQKPVPTQCLKCMTYGREIYFKIDETNIKCYTSIWYQ